MDKAKVKNIRNEYNMSCTNDLKNRTPSTAEKIQEIRQQLEEVLVSAYSKQPEGNTRNYNTSDVVINQYYSLPLNITKSKQECSHRNQIDLEAKDDPKLIAYKKFITSLTRIVQDTNQQTAESIPLSRSPNTQNERFKSHKRTVEEKDTALFKGDILIERHKDKQLYKTPRAEKTTYCRPLVAYNNEYHNHTIEKNLRLKRLVKKLVQAREKEKHNEAWNHYINELRNKHGYHKFETKVNVSRLLEREDAKTRKIITNNTTHCWGNPDICEGMLDDLYRNSGDDRELSKMKRRTWCLPSTSKHYKYSNNSYCCPMSSQGRLLMMKKEQRGSGYTLRQSGRYFRGASILVEKQSSRDKKSKMMMSRTMRSYEPGPSVGSIVECRAIQTTDSIVLNKLKSNQITNVKNKFEQVTNLAEKFKNKMLHKVDSKQNALCKIENKLDNLIESFNSFLNDFKSNKVTNNYKSEAVSCSSMFSKNSMFRTKSETYNVLTKTNVLSDVGEQKQHSTLSFPSYPITIDEILGEEKDKSEKIKKDIDKILNSNSQCVQSVQISIDIPTKDGTTEVTDSFYKRTEGDNCEVVEKVESIEEISKIESVMTIAVNTEPMGILALIRASAETVKQILSYVPNLDYVTYLARRQIDNSNTVARYVCNICSASFTRPSQLSDHIQEHNIRGSKNCCVCRHVLDRLSHRSGLFACSYCGQLFTRAYCRELHEQSCSKANTQAERSSLILLT